MCEGCKQSAPFQRADGAPYLAVHHRRRLADGDEDTVENAIALCRNCHHERHYGINYASDAAK
ncbi:HNH endonuclease signature motif containing protein [Burkholderia cepacia]|uniref:HNH endonuclease signature motif containing protein n=1 Tax=Burkholderia cepacia TaxID=292 RepID=UPI000F5AD694|nr:HNH endonuclease signature motif containing protein [Burkholderia cepacia]RQT90702.1 HNH endonuclease [Burkholderia cepacia]